MKVICIEQVEWYDGEKSWPGPSKDEVVTVAAVVKGGESFHLAEYLITHTIGNYIEYRSRYFRSLTDEEIQQEGLLEEAKELIQEKVLIER